MNKYMDKGSFAVALITLVLFVAALFTKGLSHDLFLETGVFLVSVKIIITSYKNSVSLSQLDEKIDRLNSTLESQKTAGKVPEKSN